MTMEASFDCHLRDEILTSDIRDLLRNLKLTIKIFLSRTLSVLQNPVKHMLFDVSGSTMVKYV